MRAFLYCRVAHEDSFALEHQRFLLQLYAKKAGYTIIGAADEYGSGLTLDRPALQKVTEAVVAGRVDVVLVHNQTRIGREWGMTQRYIDLLTRHKVKLLCIRDRLLFDENGAAPILTIKMRSVLCRILRSYKDTPHGRSDGIRTHGLLVPNQARYHLRYTPIIKPQQVCLLRLWLGMRGSNSHGRSQSPLHYHYANPHWSLGLCSWALPSTFIDYSALDGICQHFF